MTTQNVPIPGEFIREELDERGWSQRDLAYVLGVPEQAVNMLVSGKRGISADMAKSLGDAFDVPAELFLNLQRMHDLSRAQAPDPAVARKARLQSSYPVREMIKRGWLVDAEAPILEAQMARFFGVSDMERIPHVAHAAKKTTYEDMPPSQLAWLFRVKQIGGEMVTKKYSEKLLTEALPRLRALMSAPEEARHVPKVLADCGVRFVLVEGLPGSKIDGACVWLAKDRPVIGMTTRYDRIDNFWFVLRHEIEHVLRKDAQDLEIGAVIDADLEGANAGVGADLPEEERRANAAGADFCVPKKEMDDWVTRKQPFFSDRDLIGFARRLGVHPGLVAGQLRNRTGNYKAFTKHLVKIRSIVAPSAISDGWGHVVPTSL